MTKLNADSPTAAATAPSRSPNGAVGATGARPAAGRRRVTRLSSLHTGLVGAAALVVLLLIFIVQNTHAVDVNFLGAHLRLSLAVAMLFSAVAGALLIGAAGAARITQLRRTVRRGTHRTDELG
jgi:uncharacterized integral membrane protein